jgi:FkbM family methyltransferase
MSSHTQANAVVMDSQPQEDIVRMVVDGVEFALDLAGIHPQHARVYKMFAEKGYMYEPVMTRCLTKLLKQMNEPRFMDIGACAGYYTCYAAALLKNDARPVSSVESNPIHCQAIRRSCEVNGMRNVKVYEALLSNVVEPAAVSGFSVLVGEGQAGQGTMTIPLDQLCVRDSIPTPNIVKMDIHGSEGKALFGMPSVLREVDHLLLELHGHDRLEELSPGMKRSDILGLLWDLKFSIYCMAGHTAPPKEVGREGIRSGGFAYRLVTPENVDSLFFDRLRQQFFFVTREDIRATLGDSVHDSFLCYA